MSKNEPAFERDKKLNIHQRILAVMEDIAFINKDSRSNAMGNYMYVSHDATVAAVRGPMIRHGIVAISSVKSEKTVEGVSKKGEPVLRTEVVLTVNFMNVDDPKDMAGGDFLGHSISQTDKNPGIATSYAKKLAILVIFFLETGEDPERQNN